MSDTPLVLVVMGVSAAGKTTLGEAIAERLGWPFKEGDELHPAANVAKMSAGQPLTDADRWPWLDAVAAWIDRWQSRGEHGVITCSSLKRAYRERLDRGRPRLRFVFIDLSVAEAAQRISQRKGHFMPPSLLQSQFDDLQTPGPDEPVIVVAGVKPIQAQVDDVVAQLGADAGA